MKKTVLAILVVMLAVVSVYGANNTENESYDFAYTVNDGDKMEKTYKSTDVVNIDLRPGDQLLLYIPANATTGYQWVLKDDFEEQFIQLISTDYEAPDSEMMGAGGTSIWDFNANEEGVTTLAFEYIRPWEEDVDPEIVLLIQVHVKAK
ncbi:MAG: protease inhibitor I42 family protein [Thermotogota bacterium]